MFNETTNIDFYRNSVSEVTKSKPRKITEWSKNKENKLKRLFLVEKKSIHSIARMLGGVKITETTRKHAAEMLGIE